MEQIKPHEHRYLYQFEIIITFLGLVMIAFGLYTTTFGQTAGNTNTNVYVDPSVRNAQVYPATTGTTTGTTGSAWWNTNNNRNSTYNGGGVVSNNNTATSSSTSSTTTTTGGAGYGTTGGGSGYYGTTGGVYYGQGVNDPNAARTQGGYVPTKGSGLYGNAGIVESGAVKTQGTTLNGNGGGVFSGRYVDESLATPTQASTLSVKHCEFITKYHKFGDRGGDVPKIQQFLKDRGYYTGRVDGVYGITTFKAVRNFQRDYKDKILDPWNFDNKAAVEGTGITNVSTKYAINQMVGCPDPATIVPKTGKVLNY